MQRLTAIEKAHANHISSAYKSNDKPAFMVVMRLSYICNTYKIVTFKTRTWFIPSTFTRKILTMHRCNLALCNSTGRTWHAKLLGF
ncbi:hypothetical protein Godav_025418 [Gossypium davidsonii]|uniref:Uncharacterized protein n=1 Tax=Gossypium davidsonii TaxID=34287 RepID=A0A7J8TJZ1_GOSDV|nr:hypothetical protein [Gossypium davidsonii]